MLLEKARRGRDDACGQSQRFAQQAVRALGGSAEVLPLQLDHGQVNAQLGVAGAYTAAVDLFIDQQLHQAGQASNRPPAPRPACGSSYLFQ